MSIGIVDFFDKNENDSHGDLVRGVADNFYGGSISEYSISDEPSLEGLIEEYRAASDQHDHSAINLSLSPTVGETTNPDELLERSADYRELNQIAEIAWHNDTLAFFSAGNDGTQDANLYSATPFAFSVGALDNPLGEREDYSQGHPRMTGYWAYGDTDEGYSGTSFSAPRLSGVMGEVKETLDLSNPQAMTLYEQTAELDDGRLELDSEELLGKGSREWILDEEIIDGAYRAFLGRQPDESGSDYWADQGSGSVDTLAQVAEDAGDWNQDLVPVAQRIKGLYNTILEREADLDGMGYWLQESTEAVTWQDLTQTFVDSAREGGEVIYHETAVNTFLGSEPELIG